MLDVLISILTLMGYCVFFALVIMTYFFAFLFASACYAMKNYEMCVGVLAVYGILTYVVFEMCR